MWIPYIIFKNTDNNDGMTLETKTEVSVTKEGNFTKSGPEVADEVIVILVSSDLQCLLNLNFVD